MLVCLALGSPTAALAEPNPEDLQRFAVEVQKLVANWGNPAHPSLPYKIGPEAEDAGARYLWLWREMDQRLALMAGYADIDAGRLGVYENDEGVTVEALREALIAGQGWIAELIAATKLERCNYHLLPLDRVWPLDDSDPRRDVNVGSRRAARILSADAARLAGDGDLSGAAERCAAIMRMAHHQVQEPRPVIAHILASAMLKLGIARSLELFGSVEEFPPRGLDHFREAAALFSTRDPVGLRAAWNRSRAEGAEFVRSQVRDEHVGWKLMHEIVRNHAARAMFDGMFERIAAGGDILPRASERWSIAHAAFGEIAYVPPESFAAALEIGEALGEAIDTHWYAVDAEERFDAAQEAMVQDPTGVLLIVVHFPKSIRRDAIDGERQLAEFRKVIGANMTEAIP